MVYYIVSIYYVDKHNFITHEVGNAGIVGEEFFKLSPDEIRDYWLKVMHKEGDMVHHGEMILKFTKKRDSPVFSPRIDQSPNPYQFSSRFVREDECVINKHAIKDQCNDY